MKNKYTPVSDSEESLKTLTDEKSDTHSADGTPPPYSASNKFIDLEMADGSAQNSAQESVDNTRSDPLTNEKWWKNFSIGTATIILFYNVVCLAIIFGYKVSPYSIAFYGLAGVSIGSIFIFLLTILVTYPEWFTQAGCNMCVAVIYTGLLNVVGFVFYRNVKKIIGFEKMNDIAFYGVCFVNVAVFVLFWMNPTARERFRLLVIYIGNGANAIGNGANAIGNGIRNAVNLAFGTNRGDEVSQNEEIELQHLAEQSGEV
ncbi:uncharacterized protein SOCG_02685 [Schizosaccharomyces octosporus yFS286]|uniref:Uncharacterized protein n=1 Tax=Schizosaccharomyces octosporus (strain yFS286) TaxID=483514 RepID=S9PWK4_SCHOY|nr:uncharacterized protein SOCG_02685 [Schizosaccharomyces octosporus yFS286]EPX73461.1 hypothetical protein SOCG_02685 [Schizosaccharomyces octosporus yFS286]